MGNERIAVGTPGLMADLGINASAAVMVADELRVQGKTAMLVASDTRVLGVIAVADTLRPSARQVIAELHDLGVERAVMLTGDHGAVARAIAAQVGIDHVEAELLPEENWSPWND
ncbi:MAG: HAD family hydrolase [Thermomicrobiales bacterium]